VPRWRTASPTRSHPRHGSIPRSLNALALLANGDPAHRALLAREAKWAAGFASDSMQTWHYGYVMMFLAEYVLATGDQSVLPGLRRSRWKRRGAERRRFVGPRLRAPDGRLAATA
jgi:hypothetical protein